METHYKAEPVHQVQLEVHLIILVAVMVLHLLLAEVVVEVLLQILIKILQPQEQQIQDRAVVELGRARGVGPAAAAAVVGMLGHGSRRVKVCGRRRPWPADLSRPRAPPPCERPGPRGKIRAGIGWRRASGGGGPRGRSGTRTARPPRRAASVGVAGGSEPPWRPGPSAPALGGVAPETLTACAGQQRAAAIKDPLRPGRRPGRPGRRQSKTRERPEAIKDPRRPAAWAAGLFVPALARAPRSAGKRDETLRLILLVGRLSE